MKKTVLIVDDEFAIRELISLTLNSDYNILKAENGKQAIELLKQMPDIIVLDIMMPQMDGYEVCNIIKTNNETKHIPVIMLTAKHEIDDLKLAIKADVDEYITKPFEPEMLRKRIEEYLNQSKKSIERKLFRYGKSLHYVKDHQQGKNKQLS